MQTADAGEEVALSKLPFSTLVLCVDARKPTDHARRTFDSKVSDRDSQTQNEPTKPEFFCLRAKLLDSPQQPTELKPSSRVVSPPEKRTRRGVCLCVCVCVFVRGGGGRSLRPGPPNREVYNTWEDTRVMCDIAG